MPAAIAPEPATALVRPPRARLVVAAAVALGAVWTVAVVCGIVHPTPPPLDSAWDALMTGARTRLSTRVARLFAESGNGTAAVGIAIVAAAVVWAFRGPLWAAFVLVASLASGLDVRLLKAVAMRPRPDSVFGLGTSFPSGHTANAALLGTVLLLVLPTVAGRIGVPLVVLGMAWSRTALHAHWLTDVVAGAAVGCASGILLVALAARLVRSLPDGWWLRPGLQPSRERVPQRSA
ncbi:phosphatase PAP2 family protein [Amnibacterium sp. CER49]|uniref:phosphatase PAP2 family protein n=1 Tax=Amnibacterium sp. CER49 TaxID=3039161 RepID=UPI002448145D|nr:phosphatase PAP2 family protein [Amnibacterium sp. CER49]MDH2445424.1 phosphatase PAP2 family protein [Amnibacterium sp. CER49]